MDKEQIINYMKMQTTRPPGLTDRRLSTIHHRIMEHSLLWIDMMRHGLDQRTPDELKEYDPVLYDHAVGNFWSIVHQLYRDGFTAQHNRRVQ